METSNLEETPTNGLFVASLPAQLTEREFTNLFASSTGFVSARLLFDRNDNLVGIVEFEDVESATNAKERFQDYKFNPLSETGINILYSTRKTKPPRQFSSDRGGGERQFTSDRGGGGGGRGGNFRRGPPMGRGNRYQDDWMIDRGPRGGSRYYEPPQAVSYYQSYPYQNPNSYAPLPPDAVRTLFVDGLPLDATEREVSHIFRPWAGFQHVRILTKESQQYPNKVYNLCFVEFDNKYQSTMAMQALQGYKLDKNDIRGIHISYARGDKPKERRVPIERSNSPPDPAQNVHERSPTGGKRRN